MADDDSLLRVEFKNTQPVELNDLTLSLGALSELFKDYANKAGKDPQQDNFKLYIKELRSGSIIADLVTLADQAQFILEHVDVFAGFLTNVNDIANFFLGKGEVEKQQPTPKEARQLASIVEPVAKDFGSQFNINAMDGATVHIHQHFHINGIEANALQNGIRRFLGPDMPSTQVLKDQLMRLEQVKNSVVAKTGDRGIIEEISPKPVKLKFSSEQAKRSVLELHENPLQCIFQVDVEVSYVDGKPARYAIIDVTDVILPD